MISSFFAALAEGTHLPLDLQLADLAVEGAVRAARKLPDASVAVVDTAPEPRLALEICAALRDAYRDLSVAALLCCSQPFSPWHVQELAAAGVHGLFDMQTSRVDALRTLFSVAAGGSAFHVHLDRSNAAFLGDALAGRWPAVRPLQDAALLELVAEGLSDRDIGLRLNLSPHTISHRIDRLRDAANVRNRTELAAWAGRHGFYKGSRTTEV